LWKYPIRVLQKVKDFLANPTTYILQTLVNCEAVQRHFDSVVTENSGFWSFNDVFGIGESNRQQFAEIPDGIQLFAKETDSAEFGDHECICLKRMHAAAVRHNFNRDIGSEVFIFLDRQCEFTDGFAGGIDNFHCANSIQAHTQFVNTFFQKSGA